MPIWTRDADPADWSVASDPKIIAERYRCDYPNLLQYRVLAIKKLFCQTRHLFIQWSLRLIYTNYGLFQKRIYVWQRARPARRAGAPAYALYWLRRPLLPTATTWSTKTWAWCATITFARR